jgi:high-affinity iron transporter
MHCFFLPARRATAIGIALVILFVTISLQPRGAQAQTPGTEDLPATLAEQVRAELVQAQIDLSSDRAAAQQHVVAARDYYARLKLPDTETTHPFLLQARDSLRHAETAVNTDDAAGIAEARAEIWTAMLGAGYQLLEATISAGDAPGAARWLTLREFRTATRFSRPGADATLAVAALGTSGHSTADILQAVRADLLDTYQARLGETLADLSGAEERQFPARRIEAAVLAEGYFAILEPSMRQQRGADAAQKTQQLFSALHQTARMGSSISTSVTAIEASLSGFRAAPLSMAEQTRRAGQLFRYLNLVPIEYARGVRDGQVVKDIEIVEAITFRDGAAAAFSDLRSILDEQDKTSSAQVAEQFTTLGHLLATSVDGKQVADPSEVQNSADQISTRLKEIMPAEWQTHDTGADFDVIDTALDQMEQAVKAGEYDLAESARLEAYAILESGPEAKLVVFAPQMKQPIEDLFWYGAGEHPGLAALIGRKAPASEILASRQALDAQLNEAQRALAGMNNAPVAIASNAAVIVFREGLESVLILASLFGSMKVGAQRTLRRPLWLGTVVALVVTVITWLLAQGLLTTLASYGERLEAVVSLIAIAVLLIITNWFFHDVYWTGWMANFHRQKKRIIGGEAGQFLGLVLLGFSSIYREGFETVLFLQALVLEAGTATVLGGVAVGLAGTLLVGLLVFVVQAKLPHKKMLTFTGILIGAVLLQMVGNTVHVLQVVGWLPIHPIELLTPLLPYWTGMWLGLYATWEGILLQFAAGAFTIGSYFLAERMHKHELKLAT